MYETEPLDYLDRTIPVSMLKPTLAWTYSKFNIDRIESNYSLPALYVPPSYSKVVNYGLRTDIPKYPEKIGGVDRDKGFLFSLFHRHTLFYFIFVFPCSRDCDIGG